jgi:ferritin-like metal-binding protein YciE/sporulation protein YlmC with PRC-barrel domain
MALEELNNSNYEIMDGEPDITGWNVLNQNGEKLGEVEDLLFDPEARKVRYLIVELQANGNDILDDKYIAVPIGVATLHTEDDDVILPVDSALELANLPSYQSSRLDPEEEVQIRQVFGGSTAPYEHPQFYAHEHFNEDHFYHRGSQPDNNTIIPAEEMERTEKVDRIMDRIHQRDDEPRSTEFPQGKIVGEYMPEPGSVTTESLERENSQPVEETGNNDYQLNEGSIPEPESFEQEEAWEEEQEEAADETGSNKLMEFFINELKDLLWAERELVETLPDLAVAATSAELKSAFELHLAETETHVARLEQVFAILGLEPESRKCDAMAGILDEGDEIISATEDGTAQRDVGLIFAGQKAEHYEIASYGGMIALAKTLGYYEVAELFVLTLDEEKTADAKLTEIAESQANYEASTERAAD